MSEILSPAGGYEQAVAAVGCGADAVYLGLKRFSARAGANNFDEDEFRRITEFCHERGVKVHVAVNTVMFDDELPELADTLALICEVGADAVISQDLAVVSMAEKCCPDLALHASTQMTIHTADGLSFAKRLGFERAVLSRELPADIIAKLAAQDIETEVFVHGALCMSVSGQCYMSALTGGRSANRGGCAQPCRLPCSVKKGREDYALSLKDMSHLRHLREIEAAGVDSYKIEGRMKRPEYAALSAYAARKALSGEDYDEALLAEVFSRGGFTDGYYTARRGRDMFGRRTKEDAQAARSAYPKIHELYRREYKRSRISFDVSIKAGEPLKITAAEENGLTAVYTGDIPQAAVNRPCDEEFVKKQLSKLGDSFFELGEISCSIDGGLAVPAGALNSARRALADELCRKRGEFFSAAAKFDKSAAKMQLSRETSRRGRHIHHSIRITAQSAEQLSMLDPERTELVFLPADIAEVKKALALFPAEKLGVAMPRFTFDEQRVTEQLKEIAGTGVKHILCTNVAHIETARRLALTAHGGMGLNITNTLAVRKLQELGLADTILSPELKASQINAIGGELPTGVMAYGRLPMMLTANCPIRAQVGCKNCGRRLYDRTGREIKVRCSRQRGYVELLNPDVLCISDKLKDFSAADILMLELYDESAEQVRDIAEAFAEGTPIGLKNITRGLYYRGVARNET
ncbi:MAG: U32 family peptidase [Ruminococcus sp.]|nr:U32 family peptidase [Ruminococcus sp.]